ncbi:hypothetical protein POM88_043062 [Heracleum sosnowskyi]|uniref:SURP motif domain-containing protein n=1 Tax=Heracleum sosnowskyi TaxID=360622 RepID=A0AAD8H2N0_9APIA|nr:hypothetical protein POM88_043062 [Heracleum sosnowskyi]
MLGSTRILPIGIIRPPPDIQTIVEKTAFFVAKNGQEFQWKIMSVRLLPRSSLLKLHMHLVLKFRYSAGGVGGGDTCESTKGSDSLYTSFSLAFDTITNDYKIIRLVSLPTHPLIKSRIEIYSANQDSLDRHTRALQFHFLHRAHNSVEVILSSVHEIICHPLTVLLYLLG